MRSLINAKISGFRLWIIPEPLVPRQEDRRLGERDWGFENCPARNTVEHRRRIEEVLAQTTQEARNAAESKYDIRYSELLRLPYFDCVRFTVVDPMHLADCVLDYGPVYSFWLFSFERYNGILGKYPTNNKSVELQMMRKFTRDQDLDDLQFPPEYQEQMERIISKVRSDSETNVFTDCAKLLNIFKLSDGDIDVTDELWHKVDCHSLYSPHVICCLDDDDLYVTQVYRLFFPAVFDTVIPRSYDKYASLECAGERFGSQFSRINRCSCILAKWAARFDGEVDIQSKDLRPGIIQFFLKH